MLHVELPHVNVLSKMDLIEQYGKLGKLETSDRLRWVLTIDFHSKVTFFFLSAILYSLQPGLLHRGHGPDLSSRSPGC